MLAFKKCYLMTYTSISPKQTTIFSDNNIPNSAAYLNTTTSAGKQVKLRTKRHVCGTCFYTCEMRM